MTTSVRAIIEAGDVAELETLLRDHAELANVPIRWGRPDCEIVTKPLHFICDKVFDGTIPSAAAGRLARALIAAGADIEDRNGDPLNAAASLHATDVGLVLLDAGARTDGLGLFGETALHWAVHEADVVLARRLLEAGAPIDVKDRNWEATPIGWAIHAWGEAPPAADQRKYREVVALLVRAGSALDPEWMQQAETNGRADVVSALRGEL